MPSFISNVDEASCSMERKSCTNLVSRFGSAIHFAINPLFTLLLGASNYCRQVLSARTTKKVDNAHRQQKWLDTGVPSLGSLDWTSLYSYRIVLHKASCNGTALVPRTPGHGAIQLLQLNVSYFERLDINTGGAGRTSGWLWIHDW